MRVIGEFSLHLNKLQLFKVVDDDGARQAPDETEVRRADDAVVVSWDGQRLRVVDQMHAIPPGVPETVRLSSSLSLELTWAAAPTGVRAMHAEARASLTFRDMLSSRLASTLVDQHKVFCRACRVGLASFLPKTMVRLSAPLNARDAASDWHCDCCSTYDAWAFKETVSVPGVVSVLDYSLLLSGDEVQGAVEWGDGVKVTPAPRRGLAHGHDDCGHDHGHDHEHGAEKGDEHEAWRLLRCQGCQATLGIGRRADDRPDDYLLLMYALHMDEPTRGEATADDNTVVEWTANRTPAARNVFASINRVSNLALRLAHLVETAGVYRVVLTRERARTGDGVVAAIPVVSLVVLNADCLVVCPTDDSSDYERKAKLSRAVKVGFLVHDGDDLDALLSLEAWQAKYAVTVLPLHTLLLSPTTVTEALVTSTLSLPPTQAVATSGTRTGYLLKP
uniref:Uncharacterized protein n=1 Tax=Sexangularia sp. CB-2014 TaxID=1486929 RepID=A0A7S1VS37_9EUKA|mmetsp:Transcript_887/g.2690  ORF Transcript_887/g.2690 Transcript_887/m.2690 type:complete len:448 (+) Transcript_887:88-1431(+)